MATRRSSSMLANRPHIQGGESHRKAFTVFSGMQAIVSLDMDEGWKLPKVRVDTVFFAWRLCILVAQLIHLIIIMAKLCVRTGGTPTITTFVYLVLVFPPSQILLVQRKD